MAPKDKDTICQKSRVIYQLRFPQADYSEEYIGVSGRTLEDRIRKHLRVPSTIHQCSKTRGHPIDVDCFTIVDREAYSITRTIREAMFICINDPSFNMNLGKYQMVHIWDEVLQDT